MFRFRVAGGGKSRQLGEINPKLTKVISRLCFQTFFIFTPTWGMFPFLTHIFQLGYLNHQLETPRNLEKQPVATLISIKLQTCLPKMPLKSGTKS